MRLIAWSSSTTRMRAVSDISQFEKFKSRTSTLPADATRRRETSPLQKCAGCRDVSDRPRARSASAHRALIGRRLRSNRFFRCGALISLGDTHRCPERHREGRRDAKRCGLRHQKHLRVPIARRAITKDLVLSSRPRSVRLTMAFCRLLHDPPSLAGEERQPVPRLAAGL